MAPKRKSSEPVVTPEPKRRITRSSARTNTTPARGISPEAQQKASGKPRAPKVREPSLTDATPEAEEPPAKDRSPPPQTTTTLTITHDLVKKPIQCRQYTPTSSSNPSPTLIWTHGAGGTLSADAVVNFCTGFSKYLPVLAFQGSTNLKARTRSFHACIERVYPSQSKESGAQGRGKEELKEKRLLLGGRSMGARAAVIAAHESLAKEDSEKEEMPVRAHLVLVSYPLQGPKDDVRDQILLDLPESVSVLFVIGDGDAMCPLDLLNETRSKMVAKSQLVVVRDADHGMNIRPAGATKEVGESTGRVAAWWVQGDLKGDVQYIGREEV